MSACSLQSGNFTQERLIQINNYNNQSYSFLTSVMNRYLRFLAVMIVLLILRNAEILPETIFAWIFSPFLAYVVIVMLYDFYSYKSRGPFNFDTYVWSFNKGSASSTVPYATTDENGYQTTSNIKCSNSSCCGSGMSWDATIGKCAII